MQQVTNKQKLQELEKKNYDQMWDSEYLALLFANVVQKNPELLSDYAFNRLDKILQELAKMEMN